MWRQDGRGALTRKKGGDRQRRLSRLRPKTPQGQSSMGDFQRLVEQALEGIAEPFRSKLENVAVVVEEEPSQLLLESLGMPRGETLLGFYDGIPLTERGDWYNLAIPDRILIFRRPILSICSSPEEVREEVRRTVLHEVAHYYGISDEELDSMGMG